MTTTTAFPVLLTLQVSPQTIYDFIEVGIEVERLKMQAMQCLEDDGKYYRISSRILQAERVLTFMRKNAASGEIVENFN
jgi:hypothetical protein